MGVPDHCASASTDTGMLHVAIASLSRRHCSAPRSRIASAANSAT